MTAPGRYAAGDGSFAKSASSAAARGGVLIAVAVALGLIILAVAYDGGESDAVAPEDTTPADDTAPADDTVPADDTAAADDTAPADDDAAADDDTSSTTAPSVPLRPNGEVKVVVANGVGEPGLAGTGTATLATAGFVTEAANAVTVPTPVTAILYIEGYAGEAAAVAAALGAPASVIGAAPADPSTLVNSDAVSEFHIFVIQGEDRLAG